MARDGEPPPSPTLPHKLRGGGRTAESPSQRDRILPLSRRSLPGEGAGGWGTVDAVRDCARARSNSPLSVRNERGGAGGGAPPFQPPRTHGYQKPDGRTTSDRAPVFRPSHPHTLG